MEHDRFDVIVVGGGPAGITAAAALARSGFSVLVCEAAVYPGAENWSGAVYFTENLEDPEAFGPEVLGGSPYERKLVERGFFLYNGRSLLGGALRDPGVFRSCYTVLRPVFDRYLAEVAREHGVVLACETTVQSLIRHEGRVIGVHTERGPAYADVVFLAEGDASHLVTQEGYERVGPWAGDDEPEGRTNGDGHEGRAPHFLQGVKEVVTLPDGALEERFGLPPGGGGAYEFLLRNGNRQGRTVRLNMGGFLYTNRNSISLGFVLPIDNLSRNFEGDHNLLIEWFKGLPEIARWIEGGEVTSYGAKIIRGGGFREIPRLVDDGLAIGGAASGVGLDFPYPNFTGPATAMGLLFARAVRRIAEDNGGPGGGPAAPGASPFTSAALERAYLEPVRRTRYWRDVERLADWPGYIERTQYFFERQIDVVNGMAYVLSRPDRLAPGRWWEAIRLKRRTIGIGRIGDVLSDLRAMSRGLRLGGAVRSALGPGKLVRWLANTFGALLPSSRAGTGADGDTGVAWADVGASGRFHMIHRVEAGGEPAGRMPWLGRWYWKRFGPALGEAFADVYTNDDEPLDDKLPRALGRLIGRLSPWDAVVAVGLGAFAMIAWSLQAFSDWFRYRVLEHDLESFAGQQAERVRQRAREGLRLDTDAVEVRTSYEQKLGTISYREGERSHIKVLWPEEITARRDLAASALWNVCPAKVYEVRPNPRGFPGVVVNFDNCVKCETCWRATPDVHWSRATQQRLIYETDTPAHRVLRDHLLSRPEPSARGREQPDLWEVYWGDLAPAAEGLGAAAASGIAEVRAELARLASGIGAFGRALKDTPLALDGDDRSWLGHLARRIDRGFEGARKAWEELPEVPERLGGAGAAIWDDAADRIEEMLHHAATGHYFWTAVVGRQVVEHHLEGLETMLATLAEALPEVEPVAEEPGTARGVWRRALGWRRLEAGREVAAGTRTAVADFCEERLDARAVRALEEGESPEPGLRDGLLRLLARLDGEAGGRVRIEGADGIELLYGGRDALLEELAGRDPSLAVVASSHLLCTDLLRRSRRVPSGVADALTGGRALAAAVTQGTISNRPVADSPAAPAGATEAGAGDVELHGIAPLVPMAWADWLLVVRDDRGYLVPTDAAGLAVEEVGTIGLIGAGMRRLVFDGCRVPADRIIDLGGAIPERGAAAPAAPAAGEPYADMVLPAVADMMAIVRGAGALLLERSREHAASRVQFPGTFQDEAGRDTVAKFGAVKRMLAEMEAQRVLLESLTLIDPGPADDPWLGAAVRKVATADAFGPDEGSFSYNAGQIFGGTAYSEDDVLAKFYRDSSPFRFLIAHDDALIVEIGNRCLERRRAGAAIPVSDAERSWLDSHEGEGALADALGCWQRGLETIEVWSGSLHEPASDDDLAQVAAHRLGEAAVHALGVKVCLLRALWRLESGLPVEAVIDATLLMARRWEARAHQIVAEAELLAEALSVGDATIAAGDFEPMAEIPDAESYSDLIDSDQSADSGDWAVQPFDRTSLRYTPEILWNDPELRSLREKLESEIRERWTEPLFDGMTYGRYLEKLHKIPDEDLDYLVDRGFLRMPIPESLGGEEALKAAYYVVCEMTGRYGDGAISLTIMANTSIGTTPMLLGLEQDLPRARAELEKVRDDESILGEIRAGLDGLIESLQRPDPQALQEGFMELAGQVKARLLRSSVLKYIGGGFLRAFQAAGEAGERRDLARFGDRLREARALLDEILTGVDERIEEYPRRERAHELFLKLISAGYISAFALTEPTAGSDSGGVKTTARLASRRVHRDDDGVLWFWRDEEEHRERRNLVDADRLEFDFDDHRILYRWSDDAEPAPIDHGGYDYAKDRPGHWRTYRHGDRVVEFTDIAQIREDAEGNPVYEYWELNGAKMWITNGRFSHCFALYAQTEPEGVTGFMVDRHAEGLVVGADEEKLGQRGAPTNELSLNGVRVPRECIIGFRGRGQVNALETLNTGRTGLAVTSRSALQEMVEDAVPYLAAAEPRPLERYWMGRLTEEALTTSAVACELIGRFDHPQTEGVRMESAIGKYFGAEAQHDGIALMERLRGLDGLTHRHRIEKTRRDARVLNIYEGTNEVQRFLLLRDLARQVLSAAREAGTDAAERASKASEGAAFPELIETLEAAKDRLVARLDEADTRFGRAVTGNVNMQPVFFRLSEMAGLIKVLDAVLYRLEWAAAHDLAEEFRTRLVTASKLTCARLVGRLEALDRQYTAAWADLIEDRYPPEVRLGFLSLDPHGAPAETWGEVPAPLRPPREARPLGRRVAIAVPVKPAPVVGPEPRFDDGELVEPLWAIDPADRRALDTALDLAAREPDAVDVVVWVVDGVAGRVAAREALAAGADDAVLLELSDGEHEGGVLHDPTRVAELLLGGLRDRPADLILCGQRARDTGQGLAPYLAARLGIEQVEAVDRVEWTDGAKLSVRSPDWGGEELVFDLPCVVAVDTPSEHQEAGHRIGALARAARAELRRLRPDRVDREMTPLHVGHVPRTATGGEGGGELARTPDEAAEVLLEIAGLTDGGGRAEADPYSGELLPIGRQPATEDSACMLVVAPSAGGELGAADAEAIDAAAELAAGVGLALDVVLPVESAESARPVIGEILARCRPHAVYVVEQEGLTGFGWRGHLEWIEELWALYRGRPEWLVGPERWATAFARFAGQGPPGIDRCYAWFGVETISDGSGPVRVGSEIFDGAARAVAELPRRGGLRVVTLAKSVDVDLPEPAGTGALWTEATARAQADAGPEPGAVYLHRPQVDYEVRSDPVAALMARLGGGELTLGDAEYVVDLGYGIGGREGLDELGEPLRDLLIEELGLDSTMIGGTRKVTQDLEILPMDRQIGQTGVRVSPKLLVALAVSGAPQHIDWIDESTVVLSFNIDPDAPLMKLNEQRSAPVVHPIVGDVWETVPRFIEALRERHGGGDDDG